MKNLNPFADDEDYLNICDMLGKTYGVLPSEIRKLDWNDLLFCVKCFKARSNRLSTVLKRNKKSGIVANVSLTDIIDSI